MHSRNNISKKKTDTLRRMILYRVFASKKARSEWVHPLNQARATSGEHLKIDRMYQEFPDKCFQYTRMSPAFFDKLLSVIEPSIQKQDSNFHEAIPLRVRLYVTFRKIVENRMLV